MANEALRVTSGAFKTTPVSSLQVLNSEAPLELRRAELRLKYYYKSKCRLQSPAFGCVVISSLYNFFNHRRIKSPVNVRIHHPMQFWHSHITCALIQIANNLIICCYLQSSSSHPVYLCIIVSSFLHSLVKYYFLSIYLWTPTIKIIFICRSIRYYYPLLW